MTNPSFSSSLDLVSKIKKETLELIHWRSRRREWCLRRDDSFLMNSHPTKIFSQTCHNSPSCQCVCKLTRWDHLIGLDEYFPQIHFWVVYIWKNKSIVKYNRQFFFIYHHQSKNVFFFFFGYAPRKNFDLTKKCSPSLLFVFAATHRFEWYRW